MAAEDARASGCFYVLLQATIRSSQWACSTCRVVRYRSLAEEFEAGSCRSDALRQVLAAEDTAANAGLYVLLRAVDRFYRQHHRYPGAVDGCVILPLDTAT